MRHYEIIFMIHPDYSERVAEIIEKYKKMIHEHLGIIHRLEDWGRRQLAYSVKKLHKAHYILMNVEIAAQSINILEKDFRLNHTIIRNLIVSTKKKITEPSSIMKFKDDKKKIKYNK
ncbi:MAG: 30S ribosomal protein S6 [Buchnera aphidicola (Pentalonia nigronervosa)]|jgi:small subunit ribosomal protein S6|uniref:Small ribosomal subunit protein bS6 n=1 Tax=Buchnera aphidicola (Pentalonia nigronervosa) TaxID=1309793 RepID=A0A7H1AZ25_9GAMM|nr:MAG: 30S ribosomal protein S6 [Buchnera aphidicola (Pentalonia nigronervosa)]